MAIIKSVKGISPSWGDECFIADNATIVGDVQIGRACSVWFNAVVRGDVNNISIGNKVNIQDGAVVHCTYEQSATVIGDNVSIGHNAIVHGSTVHSNVIIGMGAIVMDHAILEENTFIAAGAVVLEHTVLESGYLYAGIPARRVKPLSDKLRNTFSRTADNYVMYAQWFK